MGSEPVERLNNMFRTVTLVLRLLIGRQGET